MTDGTPLLSICIPTYNRSKFLRVMLQALLPQVAECGDQVEVWVIDNASPDDTSLVVEESRALGPFQYYRNETNIGPLRNILKGTCEFASGKYVWILGDHNLMMPGALLRVLSSLKDHPEIEVFYSNFRCAAYPDHWPASALAGFEGPFVYFGNPKIEDRFIQQWNELIEPASALCTQAYAHIVRTSVWQDYWTGKSIGAPYSDSLTTYPHTRMLVDTVFSAKSYYLGAPAVTIFNGAQSWGNLDTQLDVYLRGLPDLVSRFTDQGLSSSTLNSINLSFCIPQTRSLLLKAIERDGVLKTAFRVFRDCELGSYVWKALWLAVFAPQYQWLSKFHSWYQNRSNWWICNCRPARWLKNQSSRW